MKHNLLITLILGLLSISFMPVSAQAASVELVPSSRVILKITSGMTVDQIIQRIYPKDSDLWPQIKQKLIETNPNSFVQYSDRLIPGTRLKLVDIKRILDKEELSPKTKVGYVARLEGRASVNDVNGRTQQLQINSQIFEGDRIETRVGARLHILMDDGAEVFLKEDSVLKISEYVITEGYGEESSSILDLLRGGLRKITGSIGASALANYQMQTGLATIGIRGTEYVIKLCKQDDCTQTVSRNDADAKLHAAVLEGAITVTTDEETQILMAMGEYGTASRDELRVLEEVTVPLGFFTEVETRRFNATIPPEPEAAVEEESSNWGWIVGILLLAVGL